MLRDRSKPAGPARARGPRGRKRRAGELEEAEEAAGPELQAPSLETCKGLLRSILTHWGPVFPGPDPAQEPDARAAPQSEAVGPAYAVASLVVSWVLRSAAERPFSRAEAVGLLGWLQSCIAPQPAVVAELLKDSEAKRGVFKLYSQLCGAGEPSGSEQVMLRLVAALGPAGTPLLPAVETLRLALDDKEEATRGDAGSRVRGRGGAMGGGGEQPLSKFWGLWTVAVEP